MTTLNLAMMTIIIGSNLMPIHTENIRPPMEYPMAQVEVVRQVEVVPVTPIEKEVMPIVPTVKEEGPVGINQDKTYEQCMREAFDRIYQEINRRLAEVAEGCGTQFQLQKMMK